MVEQITELHNVSRFHERAVGDVLIAARSDAQAVGQWLAEYRASPQTFKAYRREAERLLLWLASVDRRLSELNRETLRAFEAFLEDPQPASVWVGPGAPRTSARWRPFRAGLSPSSRRQSLVILQGLYGWLVEAGWVAHNPFKLMRDKSRKLDNQTGNIERYLEREVWQWLWQWLNREVEEGASARTRHERARLTFIFAFAYLLAPRISEMAGARMGDFKRREGRWWWIVTGKGQKRARIPLPEDMLSALTEWRLALGLSPLPEFDEPTPLLRALDGVRGISDNQLYRLIKSAFDRAARALAAEQGAPAHIEALRRATPHWLRHTAITHQAQSGISLRYLAESARHARLETTRRYLHTEANEWHAEQQRHRLGVSPQKRAIGRYNGGHLFSCSISGETMSTPGPELAQQELIEEFEMFDNWMDRYQYIIDMGKQLPAFPAEWQTEEHKIQGCQSNVWMHHENDGGRLIFKATSDAAIVSGLIGVLLRIYSERTPEEIVATTPHFLEDLGLDKHLSPTRSNGLHAMLERIYRVAKTA